MSVSRPLLGWLAVGALLWVVLGSSPVVADTQLAGSVPRDGATVTTRPQSVTLDFQSGIEPGALVGVIAPDGERVDVGPPIVVGNQVQQPVQVTSNGEYQVVFRVMAQDQHPVQGELRFTLNAAQQGSWWSRSGGQVIGLLVVLLLAGGVAALRWRASASGSGG